MLEQGDALFRRCTSTKLALPLRKREEIQEVLYGKRGGSGLSSVGGPRGEPQKLWSLKPVCRPTKASKLT